MKISTDDRDSERNRLQFLATVAVERAMKKMGLTSQQVGERLGWNGELVDLFLQGDIPIDLRILAELSLAIGVKFDFSFAEVTT